MAPRPLERYHARTRRRGVNPFVYWPIRWVLKPGSSSTSASAGSAPSTCPEGGVILASNHRSFLDPFAIGCCIGRPIYFVAKQELFKNPLLGWFLNCLGAFPIRRGASDEESMDTARALLERGQAVVIFPEGTRIRTGSLARPKRGVGRLALQSGMPVVPIAVTNSEHARRRLADQAGQGPLRCGPAAHLPARGRAVAVPRGRGHRAHLALRRAPVGVARRPAAAAHGRRRRRRLDGHRRRGGALARGCRGPARLPHRARRRRRSAPGARTRATCPASSSTSRSTSRPCPRSSSPASTSSCSPCPARACRPRWARSARAWATAPRCWSPPRVSCRRSAPRRPPSSPSA